MSNVKEFIIRGLILDPASNTPVVVLQESGGETVIPIWIGIFEANAIAMEMEHVELPRPLTHDLMKNMLTQLSVSVEKVVITALEETTYYAEIHLLRQDERCVIDSRPSDALALAVRTGASVFVADEVIRKSHAFAAKSQTDLPEEDIRKWLEDLSPDSLGKYRM